MCSTDDGCWASPRNNQRLNQTSPTDRLADNNTRSKKSKRLSHPTESIFLVRVFIFTALCIINTVLFALFLCAAILVVPACYCVRKVILYCSLRHHRHGKLKKMSASEAMWLAECANTNNTAPVSNIFFIFEGKVTLDEIQNFISHKLLLQGTLRSNNLRFHKFRHFPVRVITGYGWNEINNLNISTYVLESKETLPSMPTGLKGISEALDAKNPETLWRVLVFPGFENSEDTGVLFQVHESIADVFPSTKVVLESLDYKTIYLKRQCFLLGRLATYLCACYSGPFVIFKRLLMKRQKHFCLTRSGETNDSFQVSWSRAVDFKSVRRIKDVTRTKVDIVLLSCVAGAIRSFLQKHKVQDPDDILVCIRTDIRPQHSKLRLDNKFSLAFVKLPVGTEGAVPRLWETRRRIDQFSFTLESIIISGFIKLCLLLFPMSVGRRLANHLINKVSCTVTQIPGPNTPVYLNGKMAKMMACWTPRKTENGLSICITNHGGQIRLGLVTHHPQINDSSLFLAEFEKEVANLAGHLEKRALPSHLRWRIKMDQQVNEFEEGRENMAEEAV